MREALAWLAGTRLELALGAHGATLRRGAGRTLAGVADCTWVDDPTLDAACLAEACAPLFAETRSGRLPLAVTLGASQARLFMVAPPRNAARVADLRAAAARRLQSLYGDDPAGWALAFDGAAREPFLACAIAQARLAAVRALAAANGLRLTGLAPRFAAAWNAARRRAEGEWLVHVDDGRATLASVGAAPRACLRGVHVLRLPESGADAPWLRQQAARVALREGVEAPQRLWRVDGEAPGARVELPRLELVRGAPARLESVG